MCIIGPMDAADKISPAMFGDDVRKTIEQLKPFLSLGQVTELRALGVQTPQIRRPHVVSGYYDDIEALAQAAHVVTPFARGVYFVGNPINPALIARANNRCRPVYREPLTGDADIVRRQSLLIDVDAVRPSGISSTQEELQAALARAQDVMGWLRGEGWPDPTIIMSGNGVHLIFAVDLPVDDGGLSQRILRALSLRFDDDFVIVDPKTHRPAQLFKVPGTAVKKGDNLADRPHRQVRILFIPDVHTTVPRNVLEQVAAIAPAQKDSGTSSRNRGGIDIEKWICDHDLDVTGPRVWQGGRRWIFRVCPWNLHFPRTCYFITPSVSGGESSVGFFRGWGANRPACEISP